MCQTNRFPSVPKNLICCHSPVIKWSSCLTHRRSSNTPARPRGFPNWDCWQDSGCLHGNHSLPWTFLGFTSPVGPYFQQKRSVAQSKSKTRRMQEYVGEETTLGERGCSWAAGPTLWCGRSWGGLNFEKRHADLQPKDHLNFCLKLVRNKETLLVVGWEEALLQSMTILLALSYLQNRELGLTVLALITYCDNKMTKATWPDKVNA